MRKQARRDRCTRARHSLWPIAIGLLLLCGPGRVSSAQTAISDAVYQTIRQRMALDQENFFLYLDQDAGQNHGFASGRFSGSPANLASIHVDTGCVDDANAASGCSTDPTALDRTRGTVLRISFGPQTPGNFAGVNIEEPEHWGALQTGVGYDLQWATAIVVDVRSPGNATVRFAVGGCETAPSSRPTWYVVRRTASLEFRSVAAKILRGRIKTVRSAAGLLAVTSRLNVAMPLA